MRIITWNVNGIRAVQGKGFLGWLQQEKPDILALQETKAHPDQLDSLLKEPFGYHSYWSSAEKKGYSGTALYTLHEPLSVSYGIGDKAFDSEGRFTIAEYPRFFILSCYFPNSQEKRKRLDYKLAFCLALEKFLKSCLKKGKEVIISGDFNVAHQPIDLARPESNEESAGYYPEERAWMEDFLNQGYVDTYRNLHPSEEGYTWWSYRTRARERNIGWRIDYHVVSKGLQPDILEAKILSEVYGSDHCPYEIILKD